MIRVLDLFSGAGGGILAGVLLGWRCVGAVEIDKYCCKVLRQRQLDGCLEEFPIWNLDIREFNRRVAPSYRGMVDVIAAGFPCQPFSVAGKRRGADDERKMWPATIECIRVVRPRFAFLENTPGLLYLHKDERGRIIDPPYAGTVLGDMAECGYCVVWGVLSAWDVGAVHERQRVWMLAYAHMDRESVLPVNAEASGMSETSDPDCPVCKIIQGRRSTSWPSRTAILEPNDWWATEPDIHRVDNGLADDVVKQNRAVGNGQVPLVAATAFRLLTGDV